MVGIESGDWIEIRNGLTEGDRVVTSGQFLIDSEASLKASLKRMQSPASAKPAKKMEMNHSQHQMSDDMAEMDGMDHSQHNMGDTEMPMDMDTSAGKLTGTGVIREIVASEGKVKMSHDPIPALKWPEMTMFFRVNPAVKLDGFKAEDKVEFDLQESDTGFVIKAMRKVTN